VNPDGGGLSACHPGMRGLFLLVEAARQLRGDFKDGTALSSNDGLPIPAERQVPDAKLAAVSGTGGWFCSNGTLILGVD
jgi:acetyl-CoA acetyltransferase